MSKKQIIGGIIGIAACLGLSVMAPPANLVVAEGLDPQKSMIGMGLLVCALIWMIFRVLPEYIILLMFCCLCAATKSLTFAQAFSPFSGTNYWLLVGALVLGAAVAHSGLLKRLTLLVMKAFPGTYLGQFLGITLSGVVISPLIPSGTARLAVAGPVTKEIGHEMGLENQTKPMAGLFAALYTGFNCTSHVFLSVSFMCYSMLKFLPEGYSDVTWTDWFIWALPWSIVALGLTTIATYFYYKPTEKINLNKNFIANKIVELGTWNKGEKITMAVLAICLVLWMTERQHGISSAIVAMLGVCALMGLKVMGVKEFRAKVNWDILIYIGCMYEIGSALTTWGITKWIGGVLGPVLNPFLSNPVLFVLIFVLLVYLTRFIVISWLGVMTVYSVLLAPLAVQAGMHPFIPCFIAYVSVNVFFFDFQNLPYVSAIGIVGDMVDHNKNCVPYAIIWAAANLVACLISVPYWKMIGML